MRHAAPDALLARTTEWEDLTRWERAELGRALRRLGWSFVEIRALIPVPKSTLSGRCSTVNLTCDQIQAIRDRTGSEAGVPRDTQWRRREEIHDIRAAVASQVLELIREPLWVAGTALYWAEGSKTSNRLSLANSDPRALRLFIRWTREYLMPDAALVLKLNPHGDNNEAAAREYWERELNLPNVTFYKTYVKPDGTGHRKNHLRTGVCDVRVRRSSDALHRVLAWIDRLAESLASTGC